MTHHTTPFRRRGPASPSVHADAGSGCGYALAQTVLSQPRSDMAKTMRIGLAWITTDKGILWHNGMIGGYRSFLGAKSAFHG